MGLAAIGLLYPQFRRSEIQVRADQVSHALIIYAITLLAALAFPRVNLKILAVVFGSASLGVEVAQGAGMLKGAAQLSDLIADLIGLLAALVPLGVLRARRQAREERV